jgi:hypothetical protein
MVRPIGDHRMPHSDLEDERFGIGGDSLWRVFAKRDAQEVATAAKATIVTAPATKT